MIATQAGWLRFGDRFGAPSTGDRYRLRYRVIHGRLEVNIDDQRDIGDALVQAYAADGLEQQLVTARAETEAVLVGCARLEADIKHLRAELASASERQGPADQLGSGRRCHEEDGDGDPKPVAVPETGEPPGAVT